MAPTAYNPGNFTVREAGGQTTEVQFNTAGIITGTSTFVLKELSDQTTAVGIGTNNPVERLTVVDHISCTGNVYTSAGKLATGIGSSKWTVNGGTTHITTLGQNAGIGVATADNKLTVAGNISARGDIHGSAVLYNTLSAPTSGGKIVNGVNSPTELAWTGFAKSNDTVSVKFQVPQNASGEGVFIGEYYVAYIYEGFSSGYFSTKAGFLAANHIGQTSYEWLNQQDGKVGLWSFSYDNSTNVFTITKNAGTVSPATLSGMYYVKIKGGSGFATDNISIIG